MRPPLFLLLVLLAGLGLAPGSAADEARDARVRAMVADLEELAHWCSDQKLFRERNATYEQILLFAPDHPEARKWLKFRRGQDGGWERKGTYTPPRNFRPPPESLAERRGAIGNRFAEATLQWLEALGPELPQVRRAAALREALAAAPHRTDLRTSNGEVRASEGTWILEETRRTPARRLALAAAARHALASVPVPRTGRPTSAENAVGLPWTRVLEGRLVRVLGTTAADELEEAVRKAEACFPLFQAAFPGDVPEIPELAIFLLQSPEERDTLLQKHPRADEAFRAWAGSLASGWLPNSNTIYGYSATREGRLEWCARQPIGALLRRRFGVRSKHGWAFEGVGLYLSHLVTGRRQTFFVRRTEYGEGAARDGDLWDKLKAEGADWRRAGRALLASPAAPDFRLLLGKDVNTMNTEDMLASYVLAAYVLEGRGVQAEDWLDAIGRDQAWEEALHESLGLDVETLVARLRRWLEETASR